MTNNARIAAILLAAGKSTRMRTERPKVVHEVCGRPILAYVLDACREAGVSDCVAVVGYGKEAVLAAFPHDSKIRFVEQAEQKGTGHAVMCCREEIAGKYDHVLVLCGDAPLIRAETIKELVKRHLAEGAALTLATSMLDDPTGYGRIDRDPTGRLRGIVEHGDCTPAQRQIKEINPGYYCFRVAELLVALDQIRPNNVKNEYYLTDALAILIQAGHKAVAVSAVPAQDVFGINSRQDLALVNRVMRERINDKIMANGVTLVDPANTWIDARAEIGQDTIIYPFVYIAGPAKIGRGCRIGPFAHVVATTIPDNTTLTPAAGGRG